MTVEYEYPRNTFNLVSQTEVQLDFYVENKENILVVLGGIIVSPLEYTVTQLKSYQGARVVFNAPLTGSLVVLRYTRTDRSFNYNNTQNNIKPESLNNDFDRIWRSQQEQDVALAEEALIRATKDAELQVQIDQEEAARIAGDKASIAYVDALVDSQDINGTYLTLANYGAVQDGIADDATALVNALGVGKVVSATGSSVLATITNTADAALVLDRLDLLETKVPTTIKLPAGVISMNNSRIATLTGAHSNLTILGAATVPFVINSVQSVQLLSPATYSVVYNVADASGINVGDVLKINTILPSTAYFEGGTVRRPVIGELVVGFNKMGEINVNGSAVTVDKLALTWLQVGDLLTVKGETRTITSINSNTSITVDSPFDSITVGLQWWYYTLPLSGTISGTGTTVTGMGTAFTTNANVGDLLLVRGALYTITAIGSDTSLTINPSLSSPITNQPYSLAIAGILHKGSWPVTAVVGNQVTVRLRSHHTAPPPKNSIKGDGVTLKTILKQDSTSGDGFVSLNGVIERMDRIAIQGNLGGVGIRLNGKNENPNTGFTLFTSSGHVTLGSDSAVIEFGTGVTGFSGCDIMAFNAHFCGNSIGGINLADGGNGYLRTSVINGNGGIGLFIAGGYARISTANFCGNKLQGIRLDVGGAVYGDSPFAWGNVSHGLMLVNQCGAQFVDGYSIANGGNGVNYQNGGDGRLSRILAAGNNNHNISISNSKAEIGQSWITGARGARSGIVVDNSEVAMPNSGITGNAINGIYLLNGARVQARDSVMYHNAAYGARAEDKSLLNTLESKLAFNTIANTLTTGDGIILTDTNPVGGSRINKSTYSGTLSFAANQVHSIYIGNNYGLFLYAGSSNTSSGIIRYRCEASIGAQVITGNGATAQTTTVIPNGNGAAGTLNFYVSADGFLYIENKLGGTYALTYQLMSNILGG